MRHNNEAALPVIAVIVVAVLVVASIGIYYLASTAGYGGDNDYVPTLELELAARSNGMLYDADIDMDVDDASFLDYFFSSASVSSPDVDFPEGDMQTLKLFVYETDATGDILVEYAWDVGDMYDVNNDGAQESTWTIELPLLKDIDEGTTGAYYLWVRVQVDTTTIGSARLCVNPEAA